MNKNVFQINLRFQVNWNGKVLASFKRVLEKKGDNLLVTRSKR